VSRGVWQEKGVGFVMPEEKRPAVKAIDEIMQP
jgi:hypothetical protein